MKINKQELGEFFRGWEPGAQFLKAFAAWRVVFWIALIPISFLTGLADLTWFVTLLSLIALVLSDVATWQGSRVEVRQEAAEEREDERANS